MKFKKLLALGLATVVSMSVLAGCGNETKQPSSSAPSSSEVKQSEESTESAASSEEVVEEGVVFPLEETMEFTGLTVLASGQYKLADSAAWQAACERANIKFELTEVQNSEFSEKSSLIFAGNDYPDMSYRGAGGETYGPDGIAIPLEDLIREYAPNLTALLDERDAWAAITNPDGHIYALPQIEQPALYNGGAPLWINKKWMDDLGLKEPQSLDDLYEILKAFKENDCNGNGDPNDEIPFTFTATNSWFPSNRLLQYMPDGHHFAYQDYLAVIDGELVFYPFTDAFKENYLGFLTKLYQEGILDQNCFTQKQEEQGVIGKSSNVYGMFFRTGVDEQVPEANIEEYITLKPFGDCELPMSSGIGTDGMIITDKCEHPEVLVAFADYFYSEEGSQLYTMGVEGLNYTLNDKGEWSAIDGMDRYQYNICNTRNAAGLVSDLLNKPDSDLNPIQAYSLDQRYGENGVYNVDGARTAIELSYTEEEQKTRADITGDLRSYIFTYTAQVVTGELDLEESWDEFQKTMKDMRAEELFSIHQAAYERYISQ